MTVHFDEFGVAQPMTGSGATNAPPARYGWLGASQRSTEALGAVILMGARLYAPTTGRFLQTDPVPGGSANAYDYCNADPVNCTDLDGNWPGWTRVLKAVAFAGDIASMIPGPVGAAAGVIAGVAYLATGDKQKAMWALAGAAGAAVGVTAAVKAVRVAGTARSIAKAARAGEDLARFGEVSRRTSNLAGRMYVGRGAKYLGEGKKRFLYSKDLSLRYRAPASKVKMARAQANFEQTTHPGLSNSSWTYPKRQNLHLNVKSTFRRGP